MSLRALLFDFDGLVLDTESAEYRAWCELYERHGHPLELSAWGAGIGTLGGFDPRAHLASLGIAVDDDVYRERHRRNLELCALEEIRPGVADLLAEARVRGVATAIVSSSTHDWIAGHLGARGLVDAFGPVVCANGDDARAKPLPVLYLEALQQLGVAAHEAVALEDSPNGIAAARAAGIYCVAVPNAVTCALDLSAADMRVESLSDVTLEILEGALNGRAEDDAGCVIRAR